MSHECCRAHAFMGMSLENQLTAGVMLSSLAQSAGHKTARRRRQQRPSPPSRLSYHDYRDKDNDNDHHGTTITAPSSRHHRHGTIVTASAQRNDLDSACRIFESDRSRAVGLVTSTVEQTQSLMPRAMKTQHRQPRRHRSRLGESRHLRHGRECTTYMSCPTN